MKTLILVALLFEVAVVGEAGWHRAAAAPVAQSQELSGPARQSGSTPIAEGEYAVYEEGSNGAVGPFGEEIYDFRESWTLSRDSRGSYHVEGERRFRTSPGSPEVKRAFVVELTRDLTVLSLTEFGKLKWIADSGPLTCKFLATEMHCSAGGANPAPAKDRRIEVQQPYGLIWPISPFSLGGVVRESERDPNVVTRASLVTIEQPSQSDPIRPSILTGELQYLGTENLSVANRSWRAYKFSIKVPFHPKFEIWASLRGMLLALSVEHEKPDWPKEGLRLVRYRTSTDF